MNPTHLLLIYCHRFPIHAETLKPSRFLSNLHLFFIYIFQWPLCLLLLLLSSSCTFFHLLLFPRWSCPVSVRPCLDGLALYCAAFVALLTDPAQPKSTHHSRTSLSLLSFCCSGFVFVLFCFILLFLHSTPYPKLLPIGSIIGFSVLNESQL